MLLRPVLMLASHALLAESHYLPFKLGLAHAPALLILASGAILNEYPAGETQSSPNAHCTTPITLQPK
jgi:hypothetical protein